MATSTLPSLIPIDEYLKTSYDPDLEYLDGELKERPMVMTEHGALQSLLSQWFANHRKEWGIRVVVEARTQVSAERVRLPDVVVGLRGPWPQTLVKPPMIVIEILSPSDNFTETLNKVQDYLTMGVPNVWIIDPVARTGLVCSKNAAPQPVTRLQVENTPIYVDLLELFTTLDEDNNQ